VCLGFALAGLKRPGDARAFAEEIRPRFPDATARIRVRASIESGEGLAALDQARAYAREHKRGGAAVLFDALEALGRWEELAGLGEAAGRDGRLLLRVGLAQVKLGRLDDALGTLGRIDGVDHLYEGELRRAIEAKSGSGK
jgi:hypothetical protein